MLEKWSCWRAVALVVADDEVGVVFSPIVHGIGKRRAFGITWQPWWHVRGETIHS
jgi:hypothetical protein